MPRLTSVAELESFHTWLRGARDPQRPATHRDLPAMIRTAYDVVCRAVCPVLTVPEGDRWYTAGDHGNSLRALVKHLDEIPDRKITEVEIPTGVPLVFEVDDNLKPLCHYYL